MFSRLARFPQISSFPKFFAPANRFGTTPKLAKTGGNEPPLRFDKGKTGADSKKQKDAKAMRDTKDGSHEKTPLGKSFGPKESAPIQDTKTSHVGTKISRSSPDGSAKHMDEKLGEGKHPDSAGGKNIADKKRWKERKDDIDWK